MVTQRIRRWILQPGLGRPGSALLGLLQLGAAPGAAVAQRDYQVGPAPGWVILHEAARGAGPVAGHDGNGLSWLLFDLQSRVGPAAETYTRLVVRIDAAQGIAQAPQVSAEFDPAYQRLTWHDIRIRRGDTIINVLERARIQLLHRETEREARIYNGLITADVVLPDLRVGDILDYSFTIRGSNPVFGGRYEGMFRSTYAVPIQRVRQRLVWPAGRPLGVRRHGGAPAPDVTRGDDWVEYRLDLDAPAPHTEEGDTPSWHDEYGWVQLTEWGSWAEVVEWALPLYQPDPAAVRTIADRIAGEHLSRDARITAALRFVQDEIRYLALAMGRGSHEPRRPGVTLRDRYGDCKDKALLFISLLHALGVDAHAAFVRSSGYDERAGRLPTPLVFDHVLVHVPTDAGSYWLDPTSRHQRGSLVNLYQPDYGRALVVARGSDTLTLMAPPRATAPEVDVIERYRLSPADSSAILTVESTYRGGQADHMRAVIAGRRVEDLTRDYLNYYARFFPGVRSLGAVSTEDDETLNRLVISERYGIDDIRATEEALEFDAGDIRSRLNRPAVTRRTSPLATGTPRRVRQQIIVEWPAGFNVPYERVTVEGPALSFFREAAVDGDVLVLTYELETTSDHVMPAQVREHVSSIDRVSQALSYTVDFSGGPPGMPGFLLGLALLAAALAVPAAVALYRYDPAADPNAGDPDDPSVAGIAGWLYFLSLQVVLTPVYFGVMAVLAAVAAGLAWQPVAAPGFGAGAHAWKWPLAALLAATTFLTIVAVPVIWLFFRRRTSFPAVGQAALVATALLIVILEIIAAAMPELDMQRDVPGTGRALLVSAIWIAYLRRSLRVRSTFTRRRAARVEAGAESAGWDTGPGTDDEYLDEEAAGTAREAPV